MSRAVLWGVLAFAVLMQNARLLATGTPTMRAIVWTGYGKATDVFQLMSIPKLELKSADDVLVRVRATTAFVGDCEIRRLGFPWPIRTMLALALGWKRPAANSVLGQEISGVVEQVGENVSNFKIGDHVFGTTGSAKFGAYADYVIVPGRGSHNKGIISIKPDSISFAEAAGIPLGAAEALHFIRKARIVKGQSVMIIGGAGDIGSFAIQLAKLDGAIVTGVDRGSKLNSMSALGADHVIDYTISDYTTLEERYDVVFDVLGVGSMSGVLRILAPKGQYLVGSYGNFNMMHVVRGTWRSVISGGKKVRYGTAVITPEDLAYLAELAGSGMIKSVIDRVFSLEETADAHDYVESGQKVGSVAIRLN